ncbi:IclR family transcriptional regulator [Stutzerimonas azotifigens]|uniref:IclR family transcriptional regulator n=1 Tax=Stutzerimonas azotifigens TaxID=291995 RepID=A0ABR5Z477_9GAMM|nr:IclR family transcriptional regulator [Stutzerimonas azotifigens]MBA1275006.1 IclR family transcriptional regulator [Stutzerimonas azotifigens]
MTDNNKTQAPLGAQALFRGLAVIEAVSGGAHSLAEIGLAVGCTRSTTHRLVTALIQADYLRSDAQGYRLGPRLIELGYKARGQMPLIRLARLHLQRLADLTQDTIHLGVREAGDVLYIDKLSSTRGLEMRSRIGLRMPLALTGIGKSLMLDLSAQEWEALYQEGMQRRAGQPGLRDVFTDWNEYQAQMCEYAAGGFSFDLEENELGVRCVAAPVRDAGGEIVAAISVASAIPYMPEERLEALRPAVIECAQAISAELGWRRAS